MNENAGMANKTETPRAIESAIETTRKIQCEIEELIAAGEDIMDNVCVRRSEDPPLEKVSKEPKQVNMTTSLEDIALKSRELRENLEHLVKRMRDTF